MAKIEFVVSACLAGRDCKYNGGSNPCPKVLELCSLGKALPICPESLSGLPVPRPPCEISSGKVICKNGRDVSREFEKGAQKALQMALDSGARKAILKARSPSCGYGRIYDGTFSGQLRSGNGVWAEELEKAGFEIYTEENLPDI